MPSRRNGFVASRQRSAGFTYVGVLLAVAMMGVALGVLGQIWSHASQRERELTLLAIGQEYRAALESYFDATPGAAKEYPAGLENLLADRRGAVVRRHLRKIYADPITGGQEWGLHRQAGKIVGVHSLSDRTPIKRKGFPHDLTDFESAKTHQDWAFVVRAAPQTSTAPGSSRLPRNPLTSP